jgi:hypothetical protein
VNNQWLIIELNDAIEDITYKEIENSIIAVFGDNIEYFIPIFHEQIGSYTSNSVLMEGYAFVKDCSEVRKSLSNLKEQRIFLKILSDGSKYQTLDSNIIGGLKKKLKTLKKNFNEGSKVKIKDGIFKNLIGEIIGIEDDGKIITVKIKMMSREMIAPIPSSLLELVEDLVIA